MERPTVKKNLEVDTFEEIHQMFTQSPELYRYIVLLDKYIDNLEDALES